MQPKFNFYDFVGYLLPGSICLIATFWSFNSVIELPFTIELSSVSDSFLFIVFSYLFGHLVQAFGNQLEEEKIKTDGKWESDSYLIRDNQTYSIDFKEKLYKAINDFLKIDVEKEVQKPKRAQEVFNLCYTLVVQKGVSSQTDIFNGLYSLYRGFSVVSKYIIYTSVMVTIKEVIVGVANWQSCLLFSIPFTAFDSVNLLMSLVILVTVAIIEPHLIKRCKRFSYRFADSVYRSFYIWHISQHD